MSNVEGHDIVSGAADLEAGVLSLRCECGRWEHVVSIRSEGSGIIAALQELADAGLAHILDAAGPAPGSRATACPTCHAPISHPAPSDCAEPGQHAPPRCRRALRILRAGMTRRARLALLAWMLGAVLLAAGATTAWSLLVHPLAPWQAGGASAVIGFAIMTVAAEKLRGRR